MKKILVVILMMLLLVGCNNEAVNTENNNENMIENTVEVNAVDQVETTEETPEVAITEFVDSNDRSVTITEKPQRVVSLYGSFADLWYEAGGDLVGIIESTTLPEQAADLPRVGKMSTPNIEAIIALEPDLVILRSGYAKQEELISIFESNDINVLAVNYNNFDETMAVYKMFCDINQNSDLFNEKSVPMVEAIDEFKSHENDYSYLLLFATSKSVSAKDDNIASDIINGMGGSNIASAYQIADEESKQFSFEKILELDPDYIFVQTMGSVEDAKARLEEDVASNPAWGALTAVKEGKFIYLPKELFLYKPNMKYVDAYEHIDNILKGIE